MPGYYCHYVQAGTQDYMLDNHHVSWWRQPEEVYDNMVRAYDEYMNEQAAILAAEEALQELLDEIRNSEEEYDPEIISWLEDEESTWDWNQEYDWETDGTTDWDDFDWGDWESAFDELDAAFDDFESDMAEFDEWLESDWLQAADMEYIDANGYVMQQWLDETQGTTHEPARQCIESAETSCQELLAPGQVVKVSWYQQNHKWLNVYTGYDGWRMGGGDDAQFMCV